MIGGFIYIIFGVLLIYIGSIQLVCSMVPRETGIKFAEEHGAWVREHIFNLPPTKGEPHA